MTAYKNFVQDFPGRCMDLLNMVEQCRNINREVTLSLVVAAAGFVIPFERLKPPREYEHPSGDREKYSDYAKKISELLHCYFLGSCLHPELETTWLSGSLKTIEGDPDTWEGLKEHKKLGPKKKVSTVLNVIRNAMAHGNLYTKGDPIKQIIFASRKAMKEKPEKVGFSAITVPPPNFLSFLQKWFEFIKEQNLSPFDVWRLIDAA